MILCRKKTVNGVATTEYLLLGRKKTENDVPYVQSLSFDRKKSRLPNEYQEVEYLESHGTQYINTGYSFQSDIQEITLSFSGVLGASTNVAISGSQTSSARNSIFWYNSNTNLGLGLGDNSAGTSAGTLLSLQKNIVVANITSGNYSVVINGTTPTTSTYTGSVVTGKSYYLFGSNYNDTLEGGGSYKIYEVQLKDNSVLVRNFIPCYRKSDNEPGMYDLVNNQFYTNQGTGTFTVGPNKYIIQ